MARSTASLLTSAATNKEGAIPARPPVSFAFFNAMTWQVALGTPMVLLAERLGASAFAVGAAYSFVFLLTPIQVLSTALLPRFGYKRMMLSGWGARSLFLLPVIGLAWLAPETGQTWHVAVFIGSLFLFALFRSIGTCAWLPWINSLLTPENRGRYFAVEQVVSGVAGVGTLVICYFSLREMAPYAAFLLQYVFAFVGSWFAALALSRLPDVDKPAALPVRDVFRETPRLILARGPFRDFLVIGGLVGVAVTAIPPFCAYYLKVVPAASAAEVVSYTLAQYVGVIVGAFLIRNQIDRVGARFFFLCALFVYALLAGYWIVILRGWSAGLSLMHAGYFLLGAAASCWAAANMKYLPHVVTDENRTLAFSVNSAVTAVVSGLSPLLWGLFIKGAAGAPSVDVGAFQIFFIVVLASTGVVAMLVHRLPATAGTPGDWAFAGVMLRPFRGFTYLATLVLPKADSPVAKGVPAGPSAPEDRQGRLSLRPEKGGKDKLP